MLTKDLLRYRKKGLSVQPTFAKKDKTTLYLAESLLTLYSSSIGQSRKELEEELSFLLTSFRSIKLAKGFNKIILDKSKFQQIDSVELQEVRDELFLFSTDLLSRGDDIKYLAFKDEVTKHFKNSELLNNIYGDLPDFDLLTETLETTPERLIELYNQVLIQSLILNSGSLFIRIFNPEPKIVRLIARYLKFFRLLFEFKSLEFEKVLLLKITGPLDLFEKTQKYSLQLASFFPVICLSKNWHIEAKVKLDGTEYDLELDESSGVKPFSYTASYIPEEFEMFKKYFNEKVKEWVCEDALYPYKSSAQTVVFPDYVFKNEDTQQQVNLELFHRWHKSQVTQRINNLDQVDNYIIGIDRSIYKKELKDSIDNSGLLDKKIFLFRDFPGVDKVKNILKNNFNNDTLL